MPKKRSTKTKTKSKKNYLLWKNIGLIILPIVVLIIIFNYPAISNYFQGLGHAQVLNLKTDLPVLSTEANQDILQDVSADGLTYLSWNDFTPIPPPDSQQLRYRSPFVAPDQPDQLVATGDVADFAFVRTDNIYVIYQLTSKGQAIHWRDLQNVTVDHTVPLSSGDYIFSADTWGGAIAMIRRHDNQTTIWRYDIGKDQLTQLTQVNSDKKDLRFNGSLIVWADNRNDTNPDPNVTNYDIYAYDLNNPTAGEFQVTTDTKDQTEPDIDSPYIVWTDARNVTTTNSNNNFDIYLWDLLNNQERQITFNAKKQYHPSIYHQKITWEDWRNQDDPGFMNYNSDVYVYDLANNQELAVTTRPADQQQPIIFGNQVFWTYVYQPVKPLPNNHPARDINKATFDEFNLIAPADNLNFQFENINFQWEWLSDKTLLPNFWIKALWNGQPATNLLPPKGEKNLWQTLAFSLPSATIETLPDGIWEWAVAPEINGDHNSYWSNPLRKVIKATGANLTAPANNTVITLTPPTKFDWNDIAKSTNYVLKIKGGKIAGLVLRPDGYYYLPLNNGGGTNSQLTIGPVIYNALEAGKTYTWAIAGTALKNSSNGSNTLPANDPRLPKLSYSATPRTFKK